MTFEKMGRTQVLTKHSNILGILNYKQTFYSNDFYFYQAPHFSILSIRNTLIDTHKGCPRKMPSSLLLQ